MNQGIEKTVQDGDVLVREHGALRRLTLNRPKALNALTLDMAATHDGAIFARGPTMPASARC